MLLPPLTVGEEGVIASGASTCTVVVALWPRAETETTSATPLVAPCGEPGRVGDADRIGHAAGQACGVRARSRDRAAGVVAEERPRVAAPAAAAGGERELPAGRDACRCRQHGDGGLDRDLRLR